MAKASPHRIELREAGDDNLVLTGHASVTERPYEMGFYREIVRRNAFKRSLAGPALDVSLLIDDRGLPPARTRSGALRLSEDHTGLAVEAPLDPTDPDTAALARKMRRGDVSEMSMGSRAARQSRSQDRTERFIEQANPHRGDVSVVAAAANPYATASLRAQGLTLEQREPRVADIGERVRVGPWFWRAESESSCKRCNGTGSIKLPYSNCRGGEGPVKPESILSTSTKGGTALAHHALDPARLDLAALRSERVWPGSADPVEGARKELLELHAGVRPKPAPEPYVTWPGKWWD